MANSYYPAYGQYPYYVYPMNQQSQQSYNPSPKNMEWVEGEVGARAFLMPNGWTANTPISLWDSTRNRIYFKSWNQVGMANPLLYADYTDVKELKPLEAIPENTSGDESKYATKHDLEELQREIKNMSNMIANNQNNGSRNRGGQQ